MAALRFATEFPHVDAETGLFENWNRFYDPGTGRYSASDPLFVSPTAAQTGLVRSAYPYAHNNPLANVDASGMIIQKGYSKNYEQAIAEAKKTEEGRKQLEEMEKSEVIFKLVEGDLEPGKFGSTDVTGKDAKGKTTEVTLTVDFAEIAAEGPEVRTSADVVSHEATHGNDLAVLGPKFDRPESERRAYETTIDVRFDLQTNKATKEKYKGKELLGPKFWNSVPERYLPAGYKNMPRRVGGGP